MISPFIPIKLQKSKNIIKKQHPFEDEVVREIAPPNNLNEFILSLVKLEPQLVKMKAVSLTNREIDLVADYIPKNHYNVDLTNLFTIFQLRCSARACSVLMNAWLDYYKNEESNRFILSMFQADNPDIIAAIKNWKLNQTEIQDLLSTSDIVYRLGRMVIGDYHKKEISFSEVLHSWGIRSDSFLNRDCQFAFYTFCDKEDYLRVEKSKLSSVITQYSDIAKKKFIVRFLICLELNELEAFESLARFFQINIGDYGTEKYEVFFSGVELNITRKYRDWMNLYKIKSYFGEDERSDYWKLYRYDNVEYYKYSDSVVMWFEKYVVVEFLGKANGPLYIYDKNYFSNSLIGVFNRGYYTNSELRSYLYNYSTYQAMSDGYIENGGKGYRKVHNPNPGWQYSVSLFLTRNKIAERIY